MGGKEPDGGHDLLGNYNKAVRHGLKSSALLLQKLSHLSELHKIYYARCLKIEGEPVPVPAFISNYDDIVVQLVADVRHARLGG